MAQAKQTSKKREKEKDKQKKKKEKEQRKQERKKHSTKGLGIDALVVTVVAAEAASSGNANNKAPADQNIASEVRIGKVSYLNTIKGYGFIRDAKVKENLFFGTGDVTWEIRLNDLVAFMRTKSSRGSTATSIEKLPDPNQK